MTTATHQSRPTTVYTPPVDVWENQESYVLHADLPGVATEGVDLAILERELTLQATRVDGQAGYYRAFTLPDDADSERVSADLDNGVLRVTLPKTPEAKPRRIEITAT